MDLRSIYAPAHFGNFYECASKGEMKGLFEQWREWGINGAGTWFNPANAVDPFGTDALYQWAREKPAAEWRRKRDLLVAARDVGFKTTICVTPNAAFIDQLRPDLAASAGEAHYIGPDLCPSKPEARAILVRNFENLLRFLAEGGVSLDYVLVAFRDWGGCDCARCRPWLRTALALWVDEFVPVLARIHPAAKTQFCTWWVTDEELTFLMDVVAKSPTWLDGLNLSLGYGDELPKIELPAPCRKTVFLHIGFTTEKGDKYGTKGAVVAPARLERQMKELHAQGIAGFQAYSEGVYDDLNKFLVGQLGMDPALSARDLVADYCRTCFGTGRGETDDLVGAIYALETIEKDASKAEEVDRVFEAVGRLHRLAGDWRYAQLAVRAKVALFESRIGAPERWDRETAALGPAAFTDYVKRVDALVEERRSVLEYLERGVYRIGAQVHALGMDMEYRPWQEWKRGRKPQPKQLGGGTFQP